MMEFLSYLIWYIYLVYVTGNMLLAIDTSVIFGSENDFISLLIVVVLVVVMTLLKYSRRLYRFKSDRDDI